jgi:hypothetical protein
LPATRAEGTLAPVTARAVPAVTVAAAIALTACTGEDGSGRGTPTPDATATAVAPPPSTPEQQYAHDANEICAAARARLDEVPRPTALNQIPAAAAREIEIRQEAITRLAALDPPPGLERDVNQFARSLQARQARSQAEKNAAEANAGRRLQDVEDARAGAYRREAAQARKLGLTECTDI